MSESEIKVLLIDDDRDDYLTFESLLSEINARKFAMTWASSYDRGLELLQYSTFDICFLNHELGVKTGLDLLSEISTRKLELPYPIVLLNGYGEFDTDLEAIRLGAADCLVRDQVTPYCLDRVIRYTMFRLKQKNELKERDAQLLIQERLASVGLLASSLAHEIGTPLGVIRGRAEYVSLRHPDDQQIKKDMNILIGQVDRISKLIRTLLNVAKGEVGDSLQQLNLSQVVDEVYSLVSQALQRNGISFINELGNNLDISVLADSEPLQQIFISLFSNSIHAIEAAIDAGRSSNHFIRIRSEEVDGSWNISFEDSGCGISSDHLRNLFRPFFTTKGIGGGMGLGLALSYRVLETWKGTMQVESSVGVGTQVKISIPKARR